jgi:pimeloyl-ACP methyl ester carboxylesterase
MLTMNLSDLELAYVDAGRGPPVVLLHGSASSSRQWRALIHSLADRFRVLAPDLRGYGASTPWPGGRKLRLSDEVAPVRALADRLGQPFHLVGHSYGGVVALQTALELGGAVRSLVLIEPVVFHLLRLAGETSAWQEIEAVANTHLELVEQGQLERCAAAFVGYWVGPHAWAAMPDDRRAAIAATMPKIAAEWAMAMRGDTPAGTYARLRMPMLLLRGARTTHAALRLSELFRAMFPHAQFHEIPGAGHMAPLTHAEAVNARIALHLERHGEPVTRLRPVTHHD